MLTHSNLNRHTQLETDICQFKSIGGLYQFEADVQIYVALANSARFMLFAILVQFCVFVYYWLTIRP